MLKSLLITHYPHLPEHETTLVHIFLFCCHLCFTSLPPPPDPLLVATLPTTPGQTALRVFNNVPDGQAERGKRFFVFNVVQPTTATNIFSTGVPNNIALRNERDFYIIDNVAVSDAVNLEVMYLATVSNATNLLGSLFTNISVIGKLKHID